jgi:hypothetical protein
LNKRQKQGPRLPQRIRNDKRENPREQLVRAAFAVGMAAAAVDVGRVLDRGALSAAVIAVRVGRAGASRMGALLSVFVSHFESLPAK